MGAIKHQSSLPLKGHRWDITWEGLPPAIHSCWCFQDWFLSSLSAPQGSVESNAANLSAWLNKHELKHQENTTRPWRSSVSIKWKLRALYTTHNSPAGRRGARTSLTHSEVAPQQFLSSWFKQEKEGFQGRYHCGCAKATLHI